MTAVFSVMTGAVAVTAITSIVVLKCRSSAQKRMRVRAAILNIVSQDNTPEENIRVLLRLQGFSVSKKEVGLILEALIRSRLIKKRADRKHHGSSAFDTWYIRTETPVA